MKLLVFFVLTSSAYAEYDLSQLKCPKDTSLVDYTSSFSKERQLYCQKKVDKEFVRHGPYIVLDKEERIIENKVYVEGKVHRDLLSEKNDKNKSSDAKYLTPEELLNFVFQFTFAKAFDLAPHSNKEVTISHEDRGRCIVRAIDRMNFLIRDQSFTETRKFRPGCHLEGSVTYEFKKEIPVEYKIKSLLSYNKVNYTLYLTKIKNDKDPFTYHITAWLRDGKYTDDKNKGTLTFEAGLSFDVKVQEVVASRGHGGLYITGGHFKALKLNGQDVKFYRERKVDK